MGTDKRERQKQGRQVRLEAARAAQRRSKRLRTIRNVAILIVILVAVVWFLSRQLDDDEEVATDTSTSTSETTDTTDGSGAPAAFTYGTGECPAAEGSSSRTITFADAPQQCIDPAQSYTAVFETSEGTVRVALDTETTPGTTNNFVALSRYHYYDTTQLFRTNTGIGIIQGGSPTTNTSADPGPGYDLLDEGFDFATAQSQGGPYSYVAGDLVMARSSQPNGAGGQFFFCATDACSGLDSQGVYVKFGHVTEGLDVLEAILGLHQASNSAQPDEGSPSRTVTVESVTIEEGTS